MWRAWKKRSLFSVNRFTKTETEIPYEQCNPPPAPRPRPRPCPPPLPPLPPPFPRIITASHATTPRLPVFPACLLVLAPRWVGVDGWRCLVGKGLFFCGKRRRFERIRHAPEVITGRNYARAPVCHRGFDGRGGGDVCCSLFC